MTTPPPQDPFSSASGQGSSGQPPYEQGQYGQSPYGQGQYGQSPYGQGQYGQSPYGQGQPGAYGPPPQSWGGPGYGGPTQTETKAVVALVLAIASWLLFPVIPAIAALYVGGAARRDIDASGGRLTGDGLVTAAKVVAWVNIVLSLVGLLLLVLGFSLFAVSV